MAARMILHAPKSSQDYANFPALKHFFRCDETSGSTLSCAKTGLVFTPFELEFDAAAGTVRPNKTYATYQNDGPVSNGQWATFHANEYWLHMYVVTVREYVDAATEAQKLRVRCRIGPLDAASLLDPTGNGHKWGTSTRGNIHVALNGTNGTDGWGVVSPVSLDATFYDRTIVVCSKVTPYTDGSAPNKFIEVFDANGEALGMASSQASYTALGPGDVSPSPQAGMTGGSFHGSAWFSFQNGYPPNLSAAIAWMARNWVNNRRMICPMWEGVT